MSVAAASPQKLSLNEAEKLLATVDGWMVEDIHLTKRLGFDDFAGALAYVNKLGALAEKIGHHPDIMLGWGYVEIRLTTHDAGGLTKSDFELAGKIDSLK